MIDAQHLCFTVDDVVDKGVPAALFMAITQTLVKTRVSLSSATVLQQVNNDLARDNPSMMFVTLFLGILNIVTGELEYCNAGHNPPYRLVSESQTIVKPLPRTGGIALGVQEDFAFSANRVRLKPREALFVFTDGVTEAMNSANELFSETRLETTLSQIVGQPVQKIAEGVMQVVASFTAGAHQSDDITMLVIRYTGK